MDLEDICVQLKNRYRNSDVEFQGRLLRLNKKESVCRQLYDVWLETSDRDATYEDFKRSLRFDREGGRVEVKFAYDPTKFALAGLAGIGATAAAAGGYQWWKSKKKSAGTPVLPGASGPLSSGSCVKPTFSDWEITDLSTEMRQWLSATRPNREITAHHTDTNSDIPFKVMLAGGTVLNSQELSELESFWDTYKQSHPEGLDATKFYLDNGKFQPLPSNVDPDQYRAVSYTQIALNDDNSVGGTENSETQRIEGLDVILTTHNICSDVSTVISNGIVRIIGKGPELGKLYQTKTKRSTTYEIPQSNRSFGVMVHNPNNLKDLTYCSTIQVNSETYNLKYVHFEEGSAILDDDTWVFIEDYEAGQGVDPSRKLTRKVPRNDISNVCSIPDTLIFEKQALASS
jgi:hypothetical protein